MKKILLLFLSISMFFACAPEQKEQQEDKKQQTQEINVIHKGNVDFDAFFKNKTMRLDFFHTGNSATEHFAVDKILSDGSWHGSKNVLIDELELGPYFFEVIDKETNQLLYSRGFASIFGEWQTIPEAKEVWGTFHESIRFPWPLKPVTVIVKKRDANYDFQPIWTTDINPDARQVNPADIKHTEEVVAIHESGDPNEKLDIVLLGDGYTQEEMEKFVADAERVTDYLLSVEPYKSRKNDINVWAVKTPSQVSGISRPHPGIYKRTALSAHYSSFDSERYVLSYDNKTIRDVASAAPYEFTSILVNERTYGGGGIYKLYTTLAADNKFAKYLMVHEMGHHMAA
ncbi:MAG: M64 family metallopeptidase, partial [Bacteroidales bacterium]